MGDTPVLTWLPWKRGYRDTQLGVQDVTFPYVKSPGREADFFYSDVIASNASYIWSRRGERGSTSNLADYKGKIICVPLGYDSALARLLKDMIDRHEVEAQSAPTPRNCAAMILARRVDYVSGGEAEILGSPRDPELETQLVQSTEPVKKLEYFLMASKTNPKSLAIIARFNKELKQMRLDGRYRQLAPELF